MKSNTTYLVGIADFAATTKYLEIMEWVFLFSIHLIFLFVYGKLREILDYKSLYNNQKIKLCLLLWT